MKAVLQRQGRPQLSLHWAQGHGANRLRCQRDICVRHTILVTSTDAKVANSDFGFMDSVWDQTLDHHACEQGLDKAFAPCERAGSVCNILPSTSASPRSILLLRALYTTQRQLAVLFLVLFHVQSHRVICTQQ